MRRTWGPTDASLTSANKTRDGMEGRRQATFHALALLLHDLPAAPRGSFTT
jgi:hypothetical protein